MRKVEKVNLKPDMVFSPQPMFIIGTTNEDGTANFCIITWIGFTYDTTPHLMMTIGDTKLTKTNILRDKCFSANLISEDIIWLADYFGCSKGEEGIKDKMEYSFTWGEKVHVPVLDQSHWVYECEANKIIELEGSHLFLGDIKNIQIDKQFENMDMKKIDLLQLKPTIYAPYQYFSIKEKLGEMGDWKKNA